MDLSSERREYTEHSLSEEQAGDDPFALFGRWLAEAIGSGWLEPNAMTLATADADGLPSARTVLLKQWDSSGFVFFTRYSAQKATELGANPRASLLFHWREPSRQVRIVGSVQRVTRAESERYFATRPRGSQLAARAVSGLACVAGRAVIERRFQEEERRWAEREVPMPEDWGGYRTSPERIEFWQGRPNRLHDRLVYLRRVDSTWSRYRLAP